MEEDIGGYCLDCFKHVRNDVGDGHHTDPSQVVVLVEGVIALPQ